MFTSIIDCKYCFDWRSSFVILKKEADLIFVMSSFNWIGSRRIESHALRQGRRLKQAFRYILGACFESSKGKNRANCYCATPYTIPATRDAFQSSLSFTCQILDMEHQHSLEEALLCSCGIVKSIMTSKFSWSCCGE